MTDLLSTLQSQLIVSCQAPVTSPLHQPEMINAIATASVNQGAVGVRLDTPAHVAIVRQHHPHLPIIGLWKQMGLGSEVYITPRFEDAEAIAKAGADLIAVDGTKRDRPNGETLPEIIKRIQQELGKLVMADIDTLDHAHYATEAGADLVGTTLYGYTAETRHLEPPGYDLIPILKEQLSIPVICEGGIQTPAMAKKAFTLGADAVVVGTAITGIDLKTQAFIERLKLS